jgi:Protein of unknown function (DUF3224)
MSQLTKIRATGRIEVDSYQSQPYHEHADGPQLVEINVRERFSGDIQGDGVVRFLQAARKDGSASFVGIERVTGRIAGRDGSFLLQDAGVLQGGTVSGEWSVIPGSGTGELAGLRGEGGFAAELGQHASITLDYWFE